ncbi:hypothetical protein [Campylobacter sp. 19-13652]|uniref:hypothetical protein n=1 Tax=Campylobacter sp. 19-13652 TaxID=2840180 RepID=UPI001C7881CF|nr:hypothetical protein [Campylobacter sp. 19-13652]BCX80260.1 hypothetical protein LBC_17220 [Campylobacter sp. 19-13652]
MKKLVLFSVLASFALAENSLSPRVVEALTPAVTGDYKKLSNYLTSSVMIQRLQKMIELWVVGL